MSESSETEKAPPVPYHGVCYEDDVASALSQPTLVDALAEIAAWTAVRAVKASYSPEEWLPSPATVKAMITRLLLDWKDSAPTWRRTRNEGSKMTKNELKAEIRTLIDGGSTVVEAVLRLGEGMRFDPLNLAEAVYELGHEAGRRAEEKVWIEGGKGIAPDRPNDEVY